MENAHIMKIGRLTDHGYVVLNGTQLVYKQKEEDMPMTIWAHHCLTYILGQKLCKILIIF